MVMTKIYANTALGLGLFATGLYVVSPYFPSHGAGDGPDAPPLAAVALSTATVSAAGGLYGPPSVFDAITDAEYRTPVIDLRQSLAIVSSRPPTLTAHSAGAVYDGHVTFKPWA
jgi:hypothetical protein